MVLFILACALPGENWWPMFQLLFFVLAPIPVVLGVGLSAGGSSDVFFKQQSKNTFFMDMGLFAGTALGFSGFAYPFILFHSEVIGVQSLILCICGSLIMCVSMGAYVFFFLAKKKEPEMI